MWGVPKVFVAPSPKINYVHICRVQLEADLFSVCDCVSILLFVSCNTKGQTQLLFTLVSVVLVRSKLSETLKSQCACICEGK